MNRKARRAAQARDRHGSARHRAKERSEAAVYRLNLTKERLAAMPADERSLLLLLGNAVNEINVLQKLTLMMRKDAAPSKIVDHVEAGQILILLRLLIGKLHEAWMLFAARAKSSKSISGRYLAHLSPDAASALSRLNKHFGKGSALTAVRNKIAFHSKDEHNLVEANFQSLDASEPWEFYLSPRHVNSFYYASELVVMGSAIALVAPSASAGSARDDANGFAKLCSLTTDVARDVVDLFVELISLIFEAHFKGVDAFAVDVGEMPKVSLLQLPFFLDENDLIAGRSPPPA